MSGETLSKSLEASARLRSNTSLHAERTWGDSNPRPRARLSSPVKRRRSVSTGGKPGTTPGVGVKGVVDLLQIIIGRLLATDRIQQHMPVQMLYQTVFELFTFIK